MGRVLFFTLALVVACCAVAVVLFETQVGLDLVAKVRGDGYSQPGNIKEPKSSSSSSEERKNMEMNFARESSETRNEENANPGEAAVPDGDQESGIDKDTSSKVAEHLTVQQEGKTQDDELSREDIARDENKVDKYAGEGKLTKESEAEIPKDESHLTNDDTEPGDEPADDVVRGKQDLKQGEESNEEKEAWEYVDEKLNDEDNVEQPDTGGDKTNVGQEQVSEENRQDEPESYTGENSQQEEESKPLQEMPSENEVEEQQMESRETALPENQVEEVDDITGAQEQEDTVSVGDNLAEFEEQRKEENQESIKKEESSKPIEPEGPPIDEYPRHARRGLRGDYGGKGNAIVM